MVKVQKVLLIAGSILSALSLGISVIAKTNVDVYAGIACLLFISGYVQAKTIESLEEKK